LKPQTITNHAIIKSSLGRIKMSAVTKQSSQIFAVGNQFLSQDVHRICGKVTLHIIAKKYEFGVALVAPPNLQDLIITDNGTINLAFYGMVF
jgi:hypothetical protein